VQFGATFGGDRHRTVEGAPRGWGAVEGTQDTGERTGTTRGGVRDEDGAQAAPEEL
jgi:hypothetical protein